MLMLMLGNILNGLLLSTIVLASIAAGLAVLRLLSGPWWPSVIFQISQRSRLYTRPLWVSFGLALLLGSVLAGLAGAYAAIILWTLFAPQYLVRRGNAKAWREDESGDIRIRALAVRNLERERLNLPELDGSSPWPQYIIDAARAERQKAYQAQFELERAR